MCRGRRCLTDRRPLAASLVHRSLHKGRPADQGRSLGSRGGGALPVRDTASRYVDGWSHRRAGGAVQDRGAGLWGPGQPNRVRGGLGARARRRRNDEVARVPPARVVPCTGRGRGCAHRGLASGTGGRGGRRCEGSATSSSPGINRPAALPSPVPALTRPSCPKKLSQTPATPTAPGTLRGRRPRSAKWRCHSASLRPTPARPGTRQSHTRVFETASKDCRRQ